MNKLIAMFRRKAPGDTVIKIAPAQLGLRPAGKPASSPEALGAAAADPDFNKVMIARIEQSYSRAVKALGEEKARADVNIQNLLHELSWRRTLRDFMNK